jgi:hypothetical protein
MLVLGGGTNQGSASLLLALRGNNLSGHVIRCWGGPKQAFALVSLAASALTLVLASQAASALTLILALASLEPLPLFWPLWIPYLGSGLFGALTLALAFLEPLPWL